MYKKEKQNILLHMLISEITVGKDSKIDSNRKSKAFSRNQINNHISRAVFKEV